MMCAGRVNNSLLWSIDVGRKEDLGPLIPGTKGV